MSSPKIKDKTKKNIFKAIRKRLRNVCKELWLIQFEGKFTGPNQGAQCED